MKSVYCNAQVYTGEDAQGQAFLVEDGFFTAVGSDQEILVLAGQNAIEAALKNDPRQDHRRSFVLPRKSVRIHENSRRFMRQVKSGK